MKNLIRVLLVAAIPACAGCYDANLVIAPDDLLTLTATPDTIPANGFSTSLIVAKLTPRADRELLVSFLTSGGQLKGQTTSLSPDSNGEVRVLLESEAVPKSVVVTVQVKRADKVEASRSVTVVFERAVASTLVRLVASSSQADADGASSIQLLAEVNPSLAKTVTFETTNGSFALGSQSLKRENVSTGSDGIARVVLYAPEEIGTALVTATAGGFSAAETIRFVAAAPESIALKAAPLQISRADETDVSKLTAKLSRAMGKVTKNTRVEFSIVSDVTGASFGRFQDVQRSDANQEAKADFVAGAAAPLGLATITATVPGTNLSATIKINIVM